MVGDRYMLGPLLGQGGMAVVHEGYDRRLGRPVAVKLLRTELADQPMVRRRFETEAGLAARLTHPNVVTVLDRGDDDGTAFIVMERLSGRTLQDEIATAVLDGGSGLRLTAQMLGALRAAHAAAVIHRDIKPGNILAGSHDEWKLGDFGIAKAVELPTGDQTVTGLLLGTPAYLAPERFFGDEATVRSDLYALAVVLYEALAGRRPFVGNTPQQWASAKLAGQITPLGVLRPDVDPALTAAVDRCLHPNPEQRFETAAEMVDAVLTLPARRRATPAGASVRPDTTALLPRSALPGQSWLPPWLRLRPAGTGRGGWMRRLGAAVAAAAVLALVAVLLMSTVGTSGGSAPQPSPTTTVAGPPGTGALPPGLDQSLQHLRSEVGR